MLACNKQHIYTVYIYPTQNIHFQVHDHYLDHRGMMGRFHRTHQFPYDTKLRKKKKFKKPFKLDEPILSRELLQKCGECIIL